MKPALYSVLRTPYSVLRTPYSVLCISKQLCERRDKTDMNGVIEPEGDFYTPEDGAEANPLT